MVKKDVLSIFIFQTVYFNIFDCFPPNFFVPCAPYTLFNITWFFTKASDNLALIQSFVPVHLSYKHFVPAHLFYKHFVPAHPSYKHTYYVLCFIVIL
jgi:hypothetical protein